MKQRAWLIRTAVSCRRQAGASRFRKSFFLPFTAVWFFSQPPRRILRRPVDPPQARPRRTETTRPRRHPALHGPRRRNIPARAVLAVVHGTQPDQVAGLRAGTARHGLRTLALRATHRPGRRVHARAAGARHGGAGDFGVVWGVSSSIILQTGWQPFHAIG